MSLGLSLEELLDLVAREEEASSIAQQNIEQKNIAQQNHPKAQGQEDKLFEAGLRYLKQGEHLLAAAHFLAVTLLNPDHLKAWNNLGITYFHLGYVEQAQEAFHKVLSLEPENPLARKNLALLQKIGKGGK